MKAEEIVLKFWEKVWSPPYDLSYIDEIVTDDFVITSAGKDIKSKESFKEWVRKFQELIIELKLESLETFSNEAGDRVTTRWLLTGKNNGMFGTKPNQEPISLTGIAIWEVKENKLTHNWVERSAYELFNELAALE